MIKAPEGTRRCPGRLDTHEEMFLPDSEFYPKKNTKYCKKCCNAASNALRKKRVEEQDGAALNHVEKILDDAKRKHRCTTDDITDLVMDELGGPQAAARLFVDGIKGKVKLNTNAQRGLNYFLDQMGRRQAELDAALQRENVADVADMQRTLKDAMHNADENSTKRMFDKLNQILVDELVIRRQNNEVSTIRKLLRDFERVRQETFEGYEFEDED